MTKPTRTFSASIGQRSTGSAGPDQIEYDIDQINKMFDPLQTGGGIGTENIVDAAITTAKILDSNVTTAKIADLNVTTAKIADSNVTTPKIADANITTAKIADSNITTVKIADSNVTTTKIADAAITNQKLADLSVSNGKIAAQAITLDKLAPNIQSTGDLEVANARVSVPSNKTYDTLKARLDDEIGNLSKYIKPTGTADDTSFLQSEIDSHGNIVLKAGTYYINAETKWIIPANRTIFFEPGAILQAKTTSNGIYTVMHIATENVTIYNPVVIGDRTTHTGTTGEHGHGIVVQVGAKNIRIYNPSVKNCWGDGFVVYGGEDIYVEKLISDNNRRQGLTITNGKNVTFINPQLTNTNGTAPQSGIDIEPNYNTDKLENIHIVNPVTNNNTGPGIIVALATFSGANNNVYIKIEGHSDYGSQTAFSVGPLTGNTSYNIAGCVINAFPDYKENDLNAIDIRDYSSVNTPLIKIINPTITNPNGTNQSTRYGCGISLYRGTGDAGTTVMGNVIIENPTIIDNRTTPLMKKGIYMVDDKSVEFDKVTIDSPKRISGVSASNMIEVRKGATVRDPFHVTKLNSVLNANTIYSVCHAKVTNEGSTILTPFTLNQQVFDSPIQFTNLVGHGLKITPPATCNIVPLSTVAGKYIQTTQIGATITLRRLSDTSYVVENMNGTWTVEA